MYIAQHRELSVRTGQRDKRLSQLPDRAHTHSQRITHTDERLSRARNARHRADSQRARPIHGVDIESRAEDKTWPTRYRHAVADECVTLRCEPLVEDRR